MFLLLLANCNCQTLLIYADDVLIFCKAKNESFTTIDEVFRLFKGNTDLIVNEAKSEIFYSRSIKDKVELLNHLRFKKGSFPTKYLGLPLSPRILYQKDCLPLIKRVNSMIEG